MVFSHLDAQVALAAGVKIGTGLSYMSNFDIEFYKDVYAYSTGNTTLSKEEVALQIRLSSIDALRCIDRLRDVLANVIRLDVPKFSNGNDVVISNVSTMDNPFGPYVHEFADYYELALSLSEGCTLSKLQSVSDAIVKAHAALHGIIGVCYIILGNE